MAVGYRVWSVAKGHPDYLVAHRENRLMLCLLDLPVAVPIKREMIERTLDFIDRMRAESRTFWSNTIHLEPSVSEWTERCGVAAVAMDCFPEKPFWKMTLTPQERGANHRRWLKAGIPMIQMLTHLDRIGARFTIVALPLRLKGMDGSPARVVGIED